MSRHPILLAGTGAALGAALTQPVPAGTRILVLGAMILYCAWAVLTPIELGRLRAVIAAALVAGFTTGSLHAGAMVTIVPHTIRIACTVLGDESIESDGAAYTCATDDGTKLAVSSAGAAPPIASRVLVRGRIEAFDSARNPGEPDRAAIERDRGIIARLDSARILRQLPDAQLTLDTALARVHAWALAQLRGRLQPPYDAIVAGELWGERNALPPELRTEFQETGTVHVLVTAGLHLGVVAVLILALLRFLTFPRAIAAALTIASLWCYALFSGLHVPSMRAAAMFTFALAAFGFGRAVRAWNVYGAALLGIALFDPQAVASASFGLSFSCVGAILLCAGMIDAHLERIAALPARFREVLALTCATQLGTWPLTAAVFLLFAPYAVPANLAVVPCVGVTMMLGGAQLAFAAWPNAAQTIANVNSWILAWIVSVVHTLASLPGGTIAAMPPPPWTIVLYDALLTCAVLLWKQQARTLALALFFFGVSFVALPPRSVDHRLRITILDVGQADAIVIRTPRGRTIIVDAGGRLERGRGTESSAERAGELIVVPYLKREGIRRIDALIISHPHGDHVGAAASVLRNLSVGAFADGGQRYAGYAYTDALQTAVERHVPIAHPRAAMVWRTDDGVTLTFIGPSLPFLAHTRNDINNNSIAFILQYRSFRMLFTGDAGVEAEQRFISGRIDLRADVLKVGHHGSAYSSTAAFIAAVHPRYAIISVGRHNLFGHPAQSTIDTLRHVGARVLRTDQNGAVSLFTDGKELQVSSMLQK